MIDAQTEATGLVDLAEFGSNAEGAAEVLSIAEFIDEFGVDLLNQVRQQNPPVYTGEQSDSWNEVLDALKRQPFEAQRDVVHALSESLLHQDAPSAILNAEMGTGKTMMAICTAAVLMASGLKRALVISPPHLVYKWRREIKETVPGARVWVLNGPDTLRRLIAMREALGASEVAGPEFFILGRVRMRMGFHWRPSFSERLLLERGETGKLHRFTAACCPRCASPITLEAVDGEEVPLSVDAAANQLSDRRCACKACHEPLWTLMRPRSGERSFKEVVLDGLKQMPTIGEKTAQRLVATFGEDLLGSMLGDNVYEFLYLMDDKGDLVFTDRQAERMERSLASFEFSFGEGGYQPTEFIKRYLPQGYFGLLVVDEGHEYKNEGSAQGQAMGVLARKCKKTLLLTGTLMGGYADDLFHLLWRLNPSRMVADGFKPSARRSMAAATMQFMREHGVLKDVYKETGRSSHRTSKGTQVTHRVTKAPGFGPQGVMRYVLPCTVFLKLRDIGQDVLPPYEERFTAVAMSSEQEQGYAALASSLLSEMKAALRCGDNTLVGVVLNALLAWPDCCFRDEVVKHPRTKKVLAVRGALFSAAEAAPKEQALVELCSREKAEGRRVLVYTVYTGVRDTTARLKQLLEAAGLKVGVLKATVEAARREDWVAEQVDRGIDVLVCNQELVKTGLDLLEFPTIAFMQSGYNVYTVQQASRRSWRIGQRVPVVVHFLGYEGTAQMDCLRLMAKKIAVSQSTSGEMPDSGLDVLNDSGDSIEVELARKLLA